MSFAYAEIKLDNLERNVEAIKDILQDGVEILAVVKANAYGHGSIEVSKKLSVLNINNLAVATYEEAMEIKSAGVKSNILILGSITNEEIISSIDKNILFTIYDISQLYFIDSLNLDSISFHLKIDTGMNRLGIYREQIIESISIINKNPNLSLKGIYTHFPESNLVDSKFTESQIDEFDKIIMSFKNAIPNIDFFHISNSTGIINFPKSHLNMARPGLALYGLVTEENSEIIPVMELKTSIVKIRNIKKGDSVSYGRTFIAKEEMIIGVIPIGYADGLPRALSNKGKVTCKDKNCDILGRVCMDLTIINLSEIDNPRVGDEVIIFGTEKINANQVADLADTIPYEIVCGISKRVKRIYK